MKIHRIEKLKELSRNLNALLEEPEPGLMTWNEMLSKVLIEIAGFAPGCFQPEGAPTLMTCSARFPGRWQLRCALWEGHIGDHSTDPIPPERREEILRAAGWPVHVPIPGRDWVINRLGRIG